MIRILISSKTDPRAVPIQIDNPLTGEVFASFPGVVWEERPEDPIEEGYEVVSLTLWEKGLLTFRTQRGEAITLPEAQLSFRTSMLQANPAGYFRVLVQRRGNKLETIVRLAANATKEEFQSIVHDRTANKDFDTMGRLLREVHAFLTELADTPFTEAHLDAIEDAADSYTILAAEGIPLERFNLPKNNLGQPNTERNDNV